MKKLTAVALLSCAISAPALAADSGVYIGVDAGSASVGNAGAAGTTYSANRNTVGGIQLGYQIDKNWGVEVFYAGAGKSTSTATANANNWATETYSAKGGNVVLTLPVNDSFSFYAKLGLANTSSDINLSAVQAALASPISNVSYTAATYGAGAQYNVTPTVGIRVGVTGYGVATKNDIVAGTTYKYNSIVTYLGAVFKF